MTFGKLIAWNEALQRGIIADRIGQTFKVERKDFVADHGAIAEGLEVSFSVMENVMENSREAYAVESLSGQFRRFDAVYGNQIK